ncbi:hypothetical protein TNCV_1995191 [Trichonephila clavipes]|nr:hypothetical protein TNCV_1995191 [Trichonephila clavipes]
MYQEDPPLCSIGSHSSSKVLVVRRQNAKRKDKRKLLAGETVGRKTYCGMEVASYITERAEERRPYSL